MPERAGWKRVPARGAFLIRAKRVCGVDPARQLVTRCVSFGEAVTPTLTLPRYAGEGTGNSLPCPCFLRTGEGGVGVGRRIADRSRSGPQRRYPHPDPPPLRRGGERGIFPLSVCGQRTAHAMPFTST
jgi:hypothetical protein